MTQIQPYYQRRIFIGLTLLPPISYFFYLLIHTANLPNADDVPAILKPVTDYYSGRNTLTEVLFRRHNEHPILLVRLSALIQVFLTGTVNFKSLALSGNLSLAGIAVVLWKIGKQKLTSLAEFAPVCFILFTAQLVSSSIWTMVVWSNIAVVFVAFASLWLLASPRKYSIYPAVILMFITIFTNGNGLLVIPAGILVLFLSRSKGARWILWLVVSSMAIYFYHQTGKAVGIPTLSPSLLLVTFVNWGAFLGAYFSLVSHKLDYACIAFGLSMGGLSTYYVATALVHRLKGSSPRHDAALCGILLFMLLTALSVALIRNEGYDVTQMLFGRYRQYSVVFTGLNCLVVFFLVKNRPSIFRRLFFVVLVFSMLWNVAAYVRYQRFVSFNSRDLRAFAFNMWYNGVALPHTAWKDVNNFTPFFKESINKGYYHLTLNQFPTSAKLLALIDKRKLPPITIVAKRTEGGFDAFGCTEKLNLANYQTAASQPDAPAVSSEELYLAFYRNRKIYLIACSTNSPLFQRHKKVDWQAQLPLCRLESGSYRTALVAIEHGKIETNGIEYVLKIPWIP